MRFMSKEAEKPDASKREEEVLDFWRRNRVFELSLQKPAPKGEFVFYDGPPFATGLPHIGNLLSSIIKDVVPRYKTMRGYRVRRRWGWDCHGLPIESLVEKRLGLKTKKDIERVGVEKFNEAARASVLEFEREWERYVERIGRWVDFENSYKTMDNSYIESVWWALKELHEKDLLYEGRKVLMYCPHCETPLAKAEIAMDNTYKDVTEEAVTVKFKVKEAQSRGLPEGVSLLAWTTTPWTLPGNVALAVGGGSVYALYEREGEHVIAAERFSPKGWARVRAVEPRELEGLSYEPLYDIPALRSEASYKVYVADFVTTEEGTGIVHTAVMYGEDDFALGQKFGLPMVQLLEPDGSYNEKAPQFLRGKYIKTAEKDIKGDIGERGLLFARESHTHSYPHCYRCGTPLIYNAVASWFIRIQAVKEKMLTENEKVNWVPAHLKHGRFRNIVESAPDWTISRNRFWASPLPIWKERGGRGVMVVGSLDELKRRVKKSGNRYFLMRHGEAETNVRGIVSSDEGAAYHLTEKGREQVRDSVRALARGRTIDAVYASPFMRTKETAELAADELGIARDSIYYDAGIGECKFGEYEGTPLDEYREKFPERIEHFSRGPEGGETYTDVKRRLGQFLYDLEQKEQGKNILIISHGTPLWMLQAAAYGASKDETIRLHDEYLKPGEARELPFVPLPVNADFELDLHRPYTDALVLLDDEGREYERVPEVVDCWVESGSMPFAEYHYPFNGKEEFEARAPADFIAEYIAQTRTWFYYMHAMSVLLFGRLAFKSVVTTGTILAADGSKMSKSKGNYTDPLHIMQRYGADALRFYLMGSVVMQAEDLNFRDEDVRDAANKMVGMLWNSYKFYELYKDAYDPAARAAASGHILDRWMRARTNKAVRDVTAALDAYDTPRACRELRALVDDYSTWYLRRSRERVKGEDEADKRLALANQHEALLCIAKLAAPIVPFIAESIYRGLGHAQSVHLEAWPEHKASIARVLGKLIGRDEESRLLADMARVRAIVSRALEARDKAGIKVRQPLARLSVGGAAWSGRDMEALSALIRDEVNVKEVLVSADMPTDTVELDTELTPELKEEGMVREFIREVQAFRKAQNLKPGEKAAYPAEPAESERPLIEKHKNYIEKVTMTTIEFRARKDRS
ncbi:hypothetical protein COU20_00810 [Candidatus Kaiserbacteria bacterium CG10_big_fil_rev_8_21_14_0_10_59_10]|uniref:isoleucine--tRNA ligase n=1 Tax=Candidatus Kaiserbacteria bacterium CG10_big_fil_rev_8_21_14_0_10_59_10 TaxID=1974612 RepID=A0A2H0UAI2_9BACT|nr:MAG: hypothetical protein COU20_00810 [Candidatus Kaiserbacteria bacterium CG10_big_fil_rev_8_21_14_0_10_59_10]